MATTLKEIAEKAGVSRGTVDRALNNRGRIKPEVAENIRKIADDMGYHPNRAGRAMAVAKKRLKIGVIIQSSETTFMKQVIKGVKDARNEIQDLGGRVKIVQLKGMDTDLVFEAMDIMRQEEFHALALMPPDDDKMKDKINQFVDEGIHIITFNVDMQDTKRLCFVGMDNYQSGKAAAGLMGDIIGEKGIVCPISGSKKNSSLNERLKGFVDEMKLSFPKIEILDSRYTLDDDKIAWNIMEEELHKYEGISGVYITGYGEVGVCKSLIENNMENKIKVISHDPVEENIDLLKKQIINYMIDQNPRAQGYEPAMIAYRLLLDGDMPKDELAYTDIVIKTKYNI
ncbi:MAG: LacI family DNA-binding transcriptional regulator [Suipraeoptans sp.]